MKGQSNTLRDTNLFNLEIVYFKKFKKGQNLWEHFGVSGFSRKTRGFTECKDRFDLLLSPSPKCSQLNKTLITTTNTSN